MELPLPIASPAEVIKKVNQAINESNGRIKLAIFDQITSNTAMTLPIRELSQIAKQAGAIVCIDAAHSLFSQDIHIYEKESVHDHNHNHNDDHSNIQSFADIWLTNGHKWLSAPKGCAFMWISPRLSKEEGIFFLPIRPAVISHGYEMTTGNQKMLSGFSWDGCRDYAAMLSIPSALQVWRNVQEINTESSPQVYMKQLLSHATNIIASHWNISESEFAAPLEMRINSPMSLVT